MRTSMAFTALILIFSLLPAMAQQNQNSADNGKRLAIVIGNSKYSYSPELANPVNDARAMRDALLGLGFDVYEYENLSQALMKKAIDDFGFRLKSYSTGLFFYAGHGIQSKGSNYLIPVDANIQSEQQIEYDCVQADRVLGFMEAAGSKINIVILDACRNNPFERSWSRAINGTGLAFMNAPTGSLIAYSTSPGRTASDGAGSNGLYTEALLQNLKTPDINILQMFQNVRRTVSEKSYKQQIPWESTSLTADFFFVNAAGSTVKKSEFRAEWDHVDTGFHFYLNDEAINARIKMSWYGDNLLVWDPVTNITAVMENYEKSPRNQRLKATVIESSSNVFWCTTEQYWHVYVKGEDIAKRCNTVYVDDDLLIYDSQTNATFLLKDFATANDNKLREAEIFDNADFAFFRKTKEGSYYMYSKGEVMHNRTKNAFAGNDMIVYDTLTNITYMLKNYYTEQEFMKLRPATVLSYQDNNFWIKTKDSSYWLISKGTGIQAHTTSKYSDNDLIVTDSDTKDTYIFADFKNATPDQPRVAIIKP